MNIAELMLGAPDKNGDKMILDDVSVPLSVIKKIKHNAKNNPYIILNGYITKDMDNADRIALKMVEWEGPRDMRQARRYYFVDLMTGEYISDCFE